MTQSINNSRKGNTLRAETVRCAIYARYSSDLQRPASIEDQNRKCREECERHEGWSIVDEWIVADRGVSGASLDGRDALHSLKEAARRVPRPFDCVVIDDTSRFGRNLGDVLKLADFFQHHDVFLQFVNPPLDSRNPLFRQLLIFQGMMDENYLRDLRHKVRRGAEGRVLKGFIAGGTCYGYRNVPVYDDSRRSEHGRRAVLGVRLEVVEAEAKVIRRIFELYSKGNSLSSIAKLFNEERVSPPDSGGKSSAKGWSYLTIRDMLRREKYRGVHKWGETYTVRNPETGRKETRRRCAEEILRLPVPEWRIVTDELWERAHTQIRLMGRFGTPRSGGLNRTQRSKTYLFSGLLACGTCEHNITITSGQNASVRYGCPAHRYNGACSNHVSIRRDRLEEQLLGYLVGSLLQHQHLEYALSRFYEEVETRLREIDELSRKTAAQVGNLQADLGRLNRKAANLAEAIAENGHRKSPTLLSQLADVEAQIASIKQRLEAPPEIRKAAISRDELRDFVLKQAGDLQLVLTGDPLLAKQSLRKHIRRLVLTPRETAAGFVLDVTGDVDLFVGESNVVQSESGEGYAQHYTFPLSFNGFRLNPNDPVRHCPKQDAPPEGSTACCVPIAPLVTADPELRP